MNNKFLSMCMVSALSLTGVTIMNTPFAGAAELPKSVIKEISFLDKDGKPISGTISNDDVEVGDFNLHMSIDFPDDAKPGDYIDVAPNQKIEYAFTDKFLLENTDGVPIATVTKGKNNALRITLNDNAKDLVNRSAELTVSTSGTPFSCTEEDVKDNPLKVKVGEFDYPLTTDISIRKEACEIATNPHPDGVIPVPQMWCSTSLGYLRFKDQFVYNDREYNNVLLGFPPFSLKIQPGNTTMFNTITLQFDANSKNQPNPRSFVMNLDEFEDSIKEGNAFNIVNLPSTHFESEDPNDNDYHPKQDVLPTARLFPNKDLAASFKKEVIEKYGEDVYYNNDDAFWNTTWREKQDIYDIAVEQFQKFIADNTEVTSYNPEVGKFTAKIKNAKQLSNMVTPESDTWTDLASNNRIFRMNINITDNNGNTLFAPYQGPGLYSGLKFSYSGDLGEQYNGDCITNDDWRVGTIEGAGRGEPLPPATFEVEKEADRKEIVVGRDNKYTAEYTIKVTNTSKTTDSTTDKVIDDPNFPQGFNIDSFTSNGTTIKPDSNGKYKISDGVILKAGESKTFNVKINGTVNNPTEKALTAAGKCDINGTGNKDLGLFNIVNMNGDVIKENNDACVTAKVTKGPSLSLEKQINGDDADNAPGVKVKPGGDMDITYKMKNTGDQTAYNVKIIDKVTNGDTKSTLQKEIDTEIAKLEPFNLKAGESKDITITVKAQKGDKDQHTNIAKIVGTPPKIGDPNTPDPKLPPVESPTDPANSITPGVPVLDLEKQINGDDADNAPGVKVKPGDDMDITYKIRNTGKGKAYGLKISDEVVNGKNSTEMQQNIQEELDKVKPFDLDAGESKDITITVKAQEDKGDQHTDIAVVSGQPEDFDVPGKPDSSVPPVESPKDPANSWTPGSPILDLEKQINGDDADNAPGVKVKPGDDMKITYKMKNNGDSTAFNVKIEDQVTDGNNSDELQKVIDSKLSKIEPFNLKAGESKDITITVKAPTGLDEQHTDIAKIIGTPPSEDDPNKPDSDNPTVESPEDPANAVTPGKPGIKTIKLINDDDSNTKSDAVKLGVDDNTMNVSIHAKNTGGVTLKNVSVVDDTYVNDSIKNAVFTVLDSDGNATGKYKNGNIVLKPGEEAVISVEVASPHYGKHHVDTVTVTGIPTGDNVPSPGEPGSDSFPSKVSDDDPANAIREKKDTPDKPNKSTISSTTSKSSTTSSSPSKSSKTTLKKSSPQSPHKSVSNNVVDSSTVNTPSDNPDDYTPVQNPITPSSNDHMVDTGGHIIPSIINKIRTIF